MRESTQPVASESDGDGPERGRRLPTDRISTAITQYSGRVVLAFLLVTVVLAGGMTNGGGQETGTDQFTENLPEQQALDDMEADFRLDGRSEGGSTATLFVSDDRNVLSRQGLLRMVEFQDRAENEDGLRIRSTTSPASLVAQQLDPSAETPDEYRYTIEGATQRELERAIAAADRSRGLPVSTDFTRESVSAKVAQVAMTYDTAPAADTDDELALQTDTVELVNEIDGYESGENVDVFGNAIIDSESQQLLLDTSIVVFPAAALLILILLLLAYRDPVDLVLGLVSLMMTMVWTFGFMGYAGIPFSESFIVVIALLLAVGIDFGIHSINRYREERAKGTDITNSMTASIDQLTGAFLLTTLTTAIGFASNLTSSIGQLRDFGLVSAVGIIFTMLIFGVFLPASKVGLDRLRERFGLPSLGGAPLGSEGSLLSQALTVGVKMARIAPVVVLVSALLVGAGAAAYGTGVEAEFSQESFFPNEDRIEQYEQLPEPFSPGEYTFIAVLDHLEEDFDQGFVGSVTVYVDDPDVRSARGFRDVDRTLDDPPDAIKQERGRADATSIVSITNQQANSDPAFAAKLARADSNGDGLPERDIDEVYDELLESETAREYVTSERDATRIVYQVDKDADETEATRAAAAIAEEMEMDATPTGELVVFSALTDRLTESALVGLVLALLLTAIVLMVAYQWLNGRAIYGVINLIPVVVTVAAIAGSMRYLGISISAFNAPILSVSIGLSVDYTVHFMHRFVDEFESGKDVHDALDVTVRGTGSALTGSMLTTVFGLGVLALALIPLIAEFGILLAMSIFYAYAASILILPSTIVVWDRFGEPIVERVATIRAMR
ncbi:putative exporter of the RND superfamily [Halapricum desulfuricans]|uniref:Putative exporter of the RND superfamily n=1 Tax=Halapricum desulfuricans TaxID=2841257 RepID=A0A897NI88_9EURY|nr:MMPL family transporter [Halapricum desulfuricans]QSG10683.1 putative exporter of the RND superfamily [Halapricum desulfuricans]